MYCGINVTTYKIRAKQHVEIQKALASHFNLI